MAEQDSQKNQQAVVGLPQKIKGGKEKSFQQEPVFLSQDKIYQILSQGVIFTMEDDLKEAQKLQMSKIVLIPEVNKITNNETGLTSFEQPKEQPDVPNEEPVERQGTFQPKTIIQPKQEIKEEEKDVIKEQEEKTEPKQENFSEKPEGKETQLIEKEAQPQNEAEQIRPTKAPIFDDQPDGQLPTISLDLIKSQADAIGQRLAERKIKLLQVLKGISLAELPLQKKKQEIFLQIKQAEQGLEGLAEQEDVILSALESLEEKEAKANDFTQKHLLEEKRWAEAEKKIKIEEKRWQKEEEIEKLNLSIGKVEQALKDLNKKANVLEEEKQFYQAVKILLDLINQGSELEIFFNQKDNVGKTLKERHVELTADLERLENKINQVRQQEELIEKAVKDLKVKEKTAESPAERRKIGQELWQKEKQRKISEEERWSLEKQKEDLQQKFNLIKTNFKQKEGEFIKIKNEQSRVFNGIKDSHFWFNLLEIKTKITQKQNDRTNVKKDIGEVKIKNDFNKALDEVITSDNAQREKVLTIVKTSAEQQLKAAQVKDFQEQKKREEDKLKAIERRAKEESEDKSKVLQGPLVKEEILKQLTRVSEKEEQQRREFLARVSGTANNFTFNHQVENKEDKAMILKPLAKKISSTKKIIWRGVIILFGLCLLVFLIWQFIFKNKLFFPKAPNNEEPPIFYQEPTPNNENETLWSELEWEPEPETFLEPPNIEVITTTTLAQIELEPDLIKVEAVQLLSFTNTEEIPLLLTNLIAENNLPASSFKRIVFASSTANQVLSTKDMLDLLDVSIDENFMRRLERIDFLLYKAKEGVRFVLIAKTSESNALVANFALFEKNGFQGLKPLFQFLGFLGKPISQNFKISQTSPKFKYQTVTKNDLGVCYLIYQDYFVISSSYEAMEAVIRKLSL